MTEHNIYADVILPLALRGTLSYSVPGPLVERLKTGMRVVVPLGARKLYTGIVIRIHSDIPEVESVKDISGILDDTPLVRDNQMKLWEWMSDYYMCTPGEVYKAALPGGLKLEGESRFIVNDLFNDLESLNEDEETIFRYILEKEGASITGLEENMDIHLLQASIKNLFDKKALLLQEKIRDSSGPKTEKHIRLTTRALELLVTPDWESGFNRTPRQKELLRELYSSYNKGKTEISQSLLYATYSLNLINSVHKKQLVEKIEKEIVRPANTPVKRRDVFPLTNLQEGALENIRKDLENRNVHLIHGITSSGKTEIYIHLIKETIDKGKQVLYLLPEIALTSQIVSRIEEVFAGEIAVYHSRYSDSERVEVYRSLAGGEKSEKKLVLGVRSALFLPFRDLGLIIVDEEHENTYKQFDPAPRYHARDSAIVLAGFHGARVILGTATPSVETYMNCMSGKYGMTELFERYGGVELPEIRVVDVRKARLKKEMRSVFTEQLLSEITKTLEDKKQVILFQNRRGYSSFLECDTCGWIPRCRSCDVSLTYHKYQNHLSCHYCGYSISIPQVCGECNSTRLVTRGFGTEQVEDNLEMLVPAARIDRLDLDSTRTGKSYEKILNTFASGETDILVGTQMLSKGLDFENVALVGILNADQMLNYPDFRAFERSFQLMSQVSGRAGRKKKRGKVIIQTTDPGHPVIKFVLAHDFRAFYKDQVMERQEFKYPPFVRIISILVKSRERQTGKEAAEQLAEDMRKLFGKRVLGPQPPLVGRVKNYYLQQIILKVERKASFSKARNLLSGLLEEAEVLGKLKKVRINIDVDPL